jgi:hypothetical protein
MDHGPRLTLGRWCTRDHGVARPLQGSEGRRDSSEIDRERERGGYWGSHQWRCLEAELWRWPHDDAQQRWPMVLRWGDDSECEEEWLEPRVGAVDNVDVLVTSFIGPYDGGMWVVKGREAAAMVPQWCRLRDMKIGKGRCWGVTVFRWEEGKEARQLHGVKCERHNEERCGGQEAEGDGWRLEIKDD